jgi:hypothetical protein
MTTRRLPQLWEGLRKTDASDRAGDYRLRLCSAPQGVRIFAATVGSANDLCLVIDVPEPLRPSRLSGLQLRRVSVQVSELQGLPPSRVALVLRLLDSAFEDLFGDLAEDVLTASEEAPTPGAAIAAVCAVVTRWRRFLDGHAAPLAPEQVRGLIGELAVLERLAAGHGPAAALAAWRSPSGSIRDFEADAQSIEVKTFSPSEGATVRINDPLQLEPDHSVPLFLACQELGRSDAKGTRLPEHVERVGRWFAGDTRLAEEFRDSLASLGYLSCHAHLYSDGFALGELLLFEIVEGFPRIAPGIVMPGVSAVRFSLTVAALARFAVRPDAVIGPPTPPSDSLA